MKDHVTAGRTDGAVLVTGATGTTGSRIARRLGERGWAVRAATRRAEGTRTDAVRFDWHDLASHAPALTGVSRVYLVPPVGSVEPEAVMVPFLERALAAGVQRMVLLSSSAIPEGDGGVGAVHRWLRRYAPEWAVLRPSWFMQNFVGDHTHADSIRATSTITTATGDGRVAFVDADDIAEVAVRALADERAHNTDHLITGPEALSYADVAAVISAVAGRPVRHVPVPYETMCGHLAASGIPDRFAELLAGLDRAIAEGAEDRTSPTVEEVTGRPPRPFTAFAAEQGDAFSGISRLRDPART